jgi:ketosteroid isomerase-like protein
MTQPEKPERGGPGTGLRRETTTLMRAMKEKVGAMMQEHVISQANEALIQEYLDIVANDSENLDRTMSLMADDCVFVMEPTGDTYRGSEELRAFIAAAVSSRTHSGQYQIQVTNWFTDGEYLCIEYTHGAIANVTGIRVKVKKGVAKYCITFHMREGKFDQIHEYIQGTTFWAYLLMPLMLKSYTRQAKKHLSKQKRAAKEGFRESTSVQEHEVMEH